MKKVFTIIKGVGEKKMFLFKVRDAFYWSYEFSGSSKFADEKEAEKVIEQMPADTICDYLKIEPYFIKADQPKQPGLPVLERWL